jgi:hypothetical protein
MFEKSIKYRTINALRVSGLCLTVIAPGAVAAQGQDWSYVVAPYFWGAGQTGTVGVIPGADPVDIDLSFSDIFKNLDASGMVIGRAINGDFGFSVDAQIINMKQTGDVPSQPGLEVTVDNQNKMYSFLVDYRVLDTAEANLWLTAGARYWRVEPELTANTGDSVTGKNSWWDPVVGLHGRYDFDDRNAVIGWASLGGFGAGSDLMVDVFAGYERRFTPTTAMQLGWRYLSVDREDGGFVYDVSQTGPIVGLSFTF